MYERGYHIGNQYSMDVPVYSRACGHLNASRVIPRRHSRRLDAFSSSRGVYSMPRCTDRVAMQRRAHSDQRCGRKTENGIDASDFSSWERASLELVEHNQNFNSIVLIDFLILGDVYLNTFRKCITQQRTMLRSCGEKLRRETRTSRTELRVQSDNSLLFLLLPVCDFVAPRNKS